MSDPWLLASRVALRGWNWCKILVCSTESDSACCCGFEPAPIKMRGMTEREPKAFTAFCSGFGQLAEK